MYFEPQLLEASPCLACTEPRRNLLVPLVTWLEPKMLPNCNSCIPDQLTFVQHAQVAYTVVSIYTCVLGVCVSLPALSRLPAVLSHIKHIDPFSSQMCLWALRTGQAECLQGGASLHTNGARTTPCKAAYATRLLLEGKLQVTVLSISNAAVRCRSSQKTLLSEERLSCYV